MVTVVYTDAEIQFRFPYNQLLNQALKRTFRELGYRWDSATKGWVVQTGPVAWRVAQDWVEGLRKLGVPLQEVDHRTKRPPAAVPLGPAEEQTYRKQRLAVQSALADSTVRARLLQYEREGRRKYGALWDQD
jgi:hypothetical protein